MTTKRTPKTPFKGCIYIDDNVGLDWIDVFDNTLVITTKEPAHLTSGMWIKLDPKTCSKCGQEIQN